MAARELRHRVAERAGELAHPGARFLEAEHDGSVTDVLARRAKVNIARRLRRGGAHLIGKRLDERDGQGARLARGARERRAVEARTLACLANDFGVRGSEKSVSSARSCQCRFEARHGAEQLFVAQCRRAALVGKDELEAQKSKNTVSPLPCRMMFHSSAPSPTSRAISVARRSTGTSASTRSVPFAGSSGKYMRVTSCFSSPRMKRVTLRCGACRLFPGPGTLPGLIVPKWNAPSSSVSERP